VIHQIIAEKFSYLLTEGVIGMRGAHFSREQLEFRLLYDHQESMKF